MSTEDTTSTGKTETTPTSGARLSVIGQIVHQDNQVMCAVLMAARPYSTTPVIITDLNYMNYHNAF